MIAKVLINALRCVELFGELTPMQITEIARNAERVMFSEGATIAKSGEAADAAILVIDGKVERSSVNARPEDESISSGMLIAEMAMFTDFEHDSTFTARSAVKAMRIPREAMLAQMADDPELADRFIHKVAGRLRHVTVELAKIAAIDLSEPKPQTTAATA